MKLKTQDRNGKNRQTASPHGPGQPAHQREPAPGRALRGVKGAVSAGIAPSAPGQVSPSTRFGRPLRREAPTQITGAGRTATRSFLILSSLAGQGIRQQHRYAQGLNRPGLPGPHIDLRPGPRTCARRECQPQVRIDKAGVRGQNPAIVEYWQWPRSWGRRGKVFAMPDLTDSDILALARAARIEIPTELVTEVGYSLNALLEALGEAAGAVSSGDLDAVEPCPSSFLPIGRPTGRPRESSHGKVADSVPVGYGAIRVDPRR